MGEVCGLYIGYAPDCTTAAATTTAAAAATCPPGTGKSRRGDELVSNSQTRGGLVLAMSAYRC